MTRTLASGLLGGRSVAAGEIDAKLAKDRIASPAAQYFMIGSRNVPMSAVGVTWIEYHSPNSFAMNTLDYQSPGKGPSRRHGMGPGDYILIAWPVILLSMLVYLCVPHFVSGPSAGAAAKHSAAQSDVASIHAALEAFKRDVGRYPTASEGLGALVRPPLSVTGWKGPYLEKWKFDPWGNSYVYRVTASDGSAIDVFSSGPDGVPGTADDVR